MTWSPDDKRWPAVWDMMRRDLHRRIYREWCAKNLARQFGGCHTTWLKCMDGPPKKAMRHRVWLLAKVWLTYADEHNRAAGRLKYEALMHNHKMGHKPVRQASEKWRRIRSYIGHVGQRRHLNGGQHGGL